MNEMNPITNFFPYTDYHSMNLDFLMDLACASFGLHLVVDGQYLKLVNKCGQEISKVTIAYSETALKDTDGHNINAYILSAGADSHNLLLTHGDGNVTTITIPYSVKAEKDMNNHDITSYVRSIATANDKIVVTFGDSTTFEITVPFAVKARDDKNGKDITSYVATVEPVADKLIVKDGNGSTLSEITVPYAEKALKDGDGDIISVTYGATLSTGVSTVILRNKNGVQISEITVPYAERALKDVDGNDIKSTYGATLAVNGSKIGLNARDGSNLNEITVPFATLSNDANNAIQVVAISGDTVTFTTYDGQVTSITVPYAVKALKDSLNNTIATSYVANVTTDPITGKFSFFAGDGSLIAEMIPTVDKAVHDSFNNTIADYIKTIVTDPNSNYVTVTHGDGDVDSITIEYSTKAWKDTYGNIIGNVYIKSLEFETIDNEDYLIAYNGEDSELFRIKIVANNARYDINDNPITSYVKDVALNLSNEIEVTHGDGNVDTITLPSYSLDDLTDVTLTTPADGDVLKYDSNSSEWVNSTTPDELNELTDVTLTTPADGDYLSFDSNSNKWINKVLPTIPTVDAVSYIIQLTFTGWTYFNLLKPSGATLTVTSKKIYKVNSRTSVQQITTAVNLDDIFHKGGRVYVVYNNQTQVFEVTEDYRVSAYGKMFRAHGNNGTCDIVFEMDNTLTNTNIKAYVVPTFNALTISGGERQTTPTITYDTVNDTVTLDGLDYTFSSYSDFFVNGCKLPQAYIKVDNGSVNEGVYVPSMWYVSDTAGNIIKDTNNHYMSLARFFDTYKNDTTTQFKLNFVYFVYDSNNVMYRVKVSYIFFNNTATQVAFGSIGIDLQSFTVSKG